MERIVKVGTMPGRLVEVAVTGEKTVRRVFELAGVEILDGYEVRVDGNKVELDSVMNGTLAVQSKMIKGNASVVKVGTMPGRLVEVAVEGTEKVKDVFTLAGIEILNGYELRADGNKIDAENTIGNVSLIVQSKLIKGNNSTVKVGLMPGRLVEIILEGGETVEQAFSIAEIEIPSGYEVRVDGNKVELTDKVNGGLLVASKLIKGNK